MRKKCTDRPMIDGKQCKFALIIGYDKVFGYYLAIGKGNNMHTHHTPNVSHHLRVGTHMVSPSMRRTFELVSDAASGSSSINSRIFYNSTGSVISRNSIKYLSKFFLNRSLTANVNLGNDPKTLMEYFKNKNIKYLALMNDGQNNCFVETAENNILTLPPDCDRDAFLNTERGKDPTILPTDTLFAAIAWSSMVEKEIYNKYPWVLLVDAMAQTNREDRPLVTVCARSTGKSITLF
jgi:hypothetical protein